MIRFAIKSLAGRKLRTVLTAFAIVLGVAMMSGSYVLTDTIDKAFDTIFVDSYAGTDTVVTGKEAGFSFEGESAQTPPIPEETLERVRGVDGVEVATGSVSDLQTKLLDTDGEAIDSGGAPSFAFGIDTAAEYERFNPLNIVEGRWPSGAGEVVVDEGVADEEDFKIGDRIGVAALGPARQFEIVGIAKYGDLSSIGGATFAIFDVPTAQELLDKEGQLDSIQVAAEEGVTAEQLAQNIQAELGGGEFTVRTGVEQASEDSGEIATFTTIIRYFLLTFAGVALFVGAFVIFNTLSITVAQRMREFATLRTIGGSRRQVLGSVILEALVIGLGASIIGLFSGLGLAVGLNALFKALNLDLPQTQTVFATRTIVVSLLIGTLVTLVAGLFPAIRATKVPPIAAVREGATLPRGRFARFTPYIAAVIVVLAVLALGYGTLDDDIGLADRFILLGIGVLALFTGVAMLSKRTVAPLAGWLAPVARWALVITGWILFPFTYAFWLASRAGHESHVSGLRRLGLAALSAVIGLGYLAVSAIALAVSGAVLGSIGNIVIPIAIITGIAAAFVVYAAIFGVPAARISKRPWARIALVGVIVGLLVATVGLVVFTGSIIPVPIVIEAAIAIAVLVTAPMLTLPSLKPDPSTEQIAKENSRRNPGRTAATAAAMMIGIALVTFVSVLAQGLRVSNSDAIERQIQSDLIITSQDGYSEFPAAVGDAAAGPDGIETASNVRQDVAQIEGDAAGLTGLDDQITDVYSFRWENGSDASLAQLGSDGVVLPSNVAEDKDLAVGDSVTIRTPSDERREFVVRGIYEGSPFYPLLGSASISLEAFDELYERPRNRFTLLNVSGDVEAARASVERALEPFPDTRLQTRPEWVEKEDNEFGQFLTLLYVLLALSVVISLFGMVNTLALSVFERTRELGMLRAVGMTRRQTRRMIRHESVITALIGAALGLPLGILLAALVTQALGQFDVQFAVPVVQLVILLIVAVVAGLLAAITPARRAAKLDPLRALQYE